MASACPVTEDEEFLRVIAVRSTVCMGESPNSFPRMSISGAAFSISAKDIPFLGFSSSCILSTMLHILSIIVISIITVFFRLQIWTCVRQKSGRCKIFILCHFFAEDIAIFVVSYGKELFQILHLAAGNTPDQRTAHLERNQGLMDA